jgi:FlaA1/EpsC-like NDP-sugar epimerase
MAAEAGYDAAAWLSGLVAATWIIRNLVGGGTAPAMWRAALAVCLLQPGSGLLVGLYIGRYQRGSFDEVLAVGLAACGTALSLGVVGALAGAGQRLPLAIAGGAAAFALPAMLAARYVLFAARRRSRVTASPAVKIVIFGAGGAGTQLVHRLVGRCELRAVLAGLTAFVGCANDDRPDLGRSAAQ